MHKHPGTGKPVGKPQPPRNDDDVIGTPLPYPDDDGWGLG